MGIRLRGVGERLEPAAKAATSGIAWAASKVWHILWWCVGQGWRIVRWVARLVGPTAVVPAVIGVVTVIWSARRLSSGGEPVEREWPNDGPPRVRLLLTADAEVDDDSVGVDVRYVMDEDRLSISVSACHGHDRIAVVFARADTTVVERAETSWRLSTTPEQEATWDPADPTLLGDAASVVVIEAHKGGVDDAEAEDTCMLYGLAVAGLVCRHRGVGRRSSRRPKSRRAAAHSASTPPWRATAPSNSVASKAGGDVSARRTATHTAFASRPSEGSVWVWSSQDQVDHREPFDFADEAKVLLADVAELNHIRTRDIRLGIIAGVGAAFGAEALILFVRRCIAALRERSVAAAKEVDR